MKKEFDFCRNIYMMLYIESEEPNERAENKKKLVVDKMKSSGNVGESKLGTE